MHSLVISWEISASVSISTALRTDVNNADSLSLAIDPSRFTESGEYTFTQTTSNKFGNSDSNSFSVTITDSKSISVRIDNPYPEMVANEQRYFKAFIQDDCEIEGEPEFSWKYIGIYKGNEDELTVTPSKVVFNSDRNHVLRVDPYDLESGY